MSGAADCSVIVIGAGLFGSSLALAARQRFPRVALFDREGRHFCRASYANQARVHRGYDYPRSLLKGLRSRVTFSRFAWPGTSGRRRWSSASKEPSGRKRPRRGGLGDCGRVLPASRRSRCAGWCRGLHRADPPQYGCDFIKDSREALSLVRAVDSPGFRMHIDAGALLMAGERADDALAAAFPFLHHFHISERNLKPLGTTGVDHASCAAALTGLEYDRWASVEMRQRSRVCSQRSTALLALPSTSIARGSRASRSRKPGGRCGCFLRRSAAAN